MKISSHLWLTPKYVDEKEIVFKIRIPYRHSLLVSIDVVFLQ